jgi:hypothetical protein
MEVIVYRKDQERVGRTMAANDYTSAVGAATRAGVDVSDADQARLRRALAELEAGDDPRLAGLAGSARALLSPETSEGSVEKRADDLVRLSKASMDAAYAGELSLEDRAQYADASRDMQAKYLAAVRGR